LDIHTKSQAIDFLSNRLKLSKKDSKSKHEIVKDIIDNIVLSHIELSKGQYYLPYLAKTRYLALMIRRIIDAINDPTKIDDKDYYGNKRLELAGQLMSLLFEDLFLRFQYDVKKQVEMELNRMMRRRDPYRDPFDAKKCFYCDIITQGLTAAMKSGNWDIKRFKMNR